jgi:hypothetical protein
MNTTRKINNKPSTQKYLDINEIRENTVIMRDGTLRSVLICSSINFALKNEEEQNSIISSYVGFLNNLNFPLQIVIQSRELNIDEYLKNLKEKEKAQNNELLKNQIVDYTNYVKELVALGKIMNKKFFIVVPYSPLSDKKRNFFSRVMDAFNPVSVLKMREDRFIKLRKELERRIDSVVSGLGSVGLNVVELDTQGLIELYYDTYNPVTSINQKLVDVNYIRIDEKYV